MTASEASAITDVVSDNEKEEWEKTRWLGFITAASHGAKCDKPQDLLRFHWDEQDVTKVTDNRTYEEKVKSFEKMISIIQSEATVFNPFDTTEINKPELNTQQEKI